MAQQLTQSDVAEKVGVSRVAIAFALSPNPKLHRKLRPETRQRILAAVDQMGYVPHQAARRMARKRRAFEQIGFMYVTGTGVRHLDDACISMMYGAEEELSRADASLLFVRV